MNMATVNSVRSRSPCEIFAERWTPVILRSLFHGANRFNELHRGVPLISRRSLRSACGILKRPGSSLMAPVSTGRGYCYRLTQAARNFDRS